MADEPGTARKGDDQSSMAFIDRYRLLLEQQGAEAASRRQGEIEDLILYGPPGSTQPSLFAEELRQARERGEAERARAGAIPPDLLILCIGYSPEPLLLAVAHHAPAEVVLLVEQNLRATYLQSLAQLWDHFREILVAPAFAQLAQRTVRDSPGDVYSSVRRIAAERPGARLLLDITGAKKSMTAGAFLAAGFLDLETSYVDFSDYDPQLRRPVPGTSRPGRLDHPYRLFKLREEARLRDEFDRRRYREAERLALSLAEAAESAEVVAILGAGEARQQAERLGTVARAARGYAFWSEGFYREALAELEAGGAPAPATVARLAARWPRTDEGPEAIVRALAPRAVFSDPARALAYFVDVLVWNGEARVLEDPRQAFLRLYGTIETIVYFAFDTFVSRRPERLRIESEDSAGFATFRARYPRDRQGAELDWDDVLRAAAIEDGERSSSLALKILGGTAFKPGESAPSGRKLLKGAWAGLPPCGAILEAPPLPKAVLREIFEAEDEGQGLRHFSDLRHKAVHWLAPVPREESARLLKYYGSVLHKLIPPILAHLREDATELDAAARRSLDEWEERLLAAAAGEIRGDCQPLSYAALTASTRS